MKKKIIIIGIILVGFLFFGLHASSKSFHDSIMETEYTGEDTPDSIHVSMVKSGASSGQQETSHGVEHGESMARKAGSPESDGIRSIVSNFAETELSTSHEPANHQITPDVIDQKKAEHEVQKTYKKLTARTQINTRHSADSESGFSTGTWAILVGTLLVMGLLIVFLMKGINKMKNLKLGTKIIGMVSIILVLMVISSGFGIIKVGSIGDEIKGIAEEDIPMTDLATEITVNQLEQAISLERALRYGEVLAAEEAAEKGLSEAEEEFEKYSILADDEFKKVKELAAHSAQIAKTAEAREAFENIDLNLKDIEKQHGDYEDHVHRIFALIDEGKIHEAEEEAEKVEMKEEALDHELEEFLKTIENFTEEAALKAEHDEQSAVRGMSVISIFSVLLGLLMGILLTRSITRPVNRIIEELKGGSEQVAAASGQISSSSQQMAGGASEQAASIEETSSSLEEMSAMTRQNAKNAGEANNLMKDANQVVVQANDAMIALTTSMEEISKASEETSKIIKTIDEIAFQTNLLALNAAVEAARAGEAGAGFAVVADEVRNLAMRAAEASKNTADLIEDTVKRVKDGSELLVKTNNAFTKVAGSTGKVGELVDEIAAASNDQAEGIEQVNLAVGEMDKVVQLNAANAEESASASEEMNAQAIQMRQFVADLLAIVGGNKNGNGNNGSKVRSISHGALSTGKRVKAVTTAPPGGKETLISKGVEVSPEKLIPMENDGFTDF